METVTGAVITVLGVLAATVGATGPVAVTTGVELTGVDTGATTGAVGCDTTEVVGVDELTDVVVVVVVEFDVVVAPGVERVPVAVDVDVPAGGIFVVGGSAVGDDAVEVEDVVGAGVVVTATSPADPLPADDVFDVAPEVVPVVEAVVVAGATAAAAAPLAVALKFFWRIMASSMLTFAS